MSNTKVTEIANLTEVLEGLKAEAIAVANKAQEPIAKLQWLLSQAVQALVKMMYPGTKYDYLVSLIQARPYSSSGGMEIKIPREKEGYWWDITLSEKTDWSSRGETVRGYDLQGQSMNIQLGTEELHERLYVIAFNALLANSDELIRLYKQYKVDKASELVEYKKAEAKVTSMENVLNTLRSEHKAETKNKMFASKEEVRFVDYTDYSNTYDRKSGVTEYYNYIAKKEARISYGAGKHDSYYGVNGYRIIKGDSAAKTFEVELFIIRRSSETDAPIIVYNETVTIVKLRRTYMNDLIDAANNWNSEVAAETSAENIKKVIAHGGKTI